METINRNAEKNIYYFDVNTFLLSKKETIIQRENRIESFTEIYDNYQKFDNVMLPSKIINKSETMNSISKHDYKINIDYNDSIFNPNN